MQQAKTNDDGDKMNMKYFNNWQFSWNYKLDDAD